MKILNCVDVAKRVDYRRSVHILVYQGIAFLCGIMLLSKYYIKPANC